jgi:hypothetical protein
VDLTAASKGTPRKPKAQRRQNARREQATSERVVVDGLLDAIEKRLAQLS